ncbi:MAG: TonB-dependent receptor [Bacteroidales bacterium]|nr:TonB-dependent receptor [Bacteroidales bacterium]
MMHEILPTGRKALQINLDTNFYGTFAEIGGGQEVARHFFMAGGASGTIAKTISAYDKSFSDANYCTEKNERYVSEERLVKMLNHEYGELEKVLSGKKHDTRYFVFADTVEVLNYQKTNYSHGWLGMRFQLTPDSRPNTIIMHVKLLENDGQLQQATLGVLGVNLIYAAIHYYDRPQLFLESMTDNLSSDRFSINAIRMSGPELDYVDNRLLAVQLVKTGMSHAIMFDKNGNVQQPSDMLYKKNVLAFRGSFRPITYISWDILSKSMELFQRDEDYQEDNTLSFCEITLNNLLSNGKEDINEKDFLERVNMLNEIGQNVMVSDFREYYRLVEFFGQFKLTKLRIVMGVPTLEKVMDDKYYKHLKGGLLEALGKMFPENLKFYIYPTLLKAKRKNELITSANINIQEKYRPLYEYLIQNHYILDIQSGLSEQLRIKSREVLKMIQKENSEWEKYVPMAIAKTIKAKSLFMD